MKLAIASDLHLEMYLNPPFQIREDITDADILILAGDIVSYGNHYLLDKLLKGWRKPVLYVMGNHEYYGNVSINHSDYFIRDYLQKFKNAKILQNEGITYKGIHFFWWHDVD